MKVESEIKVEDPRRKVGDFHVRMIIVSSENRDTIGRVRFNKLKKRLEFSQIHGSKSRG